MRTKIMGPNKGMLSGNRQTVLFWITLGICITIVATVGISQAYALSLSTPSMYFQFNSWASLSEKTNVLVSEVLTKTIKATVTGASFNRSGGVYKDGAYEFDGKNDKITIPDNDNLSVSTTGEMTISMWVKFGQTSFIGEGSGKDYIHFAGKGGYGNDNEWVFRQYNSSNGDNRPNRVSFYIFNLKGGLGAGSYVQEDIKVGQWVNIVGVVRGKNVEIWKNGVLKDKDPLSGYDIVPQNGNAPVNIGTSDGDSYFKGSIDELKIYNKALSASEIKAIYNEKI